MFTLWEFLSNAEQRQKLNEFKKYSLATEAAINILFVYGNEALSVRSCQRWFGQFRPGNLSFEDSSQSSPANIDLLQSAEKKTAEKLAKQCKTRHTPIINSKKLSKLDQWLPYCLPASRLNKKLHFFVVEAYIVTKFFLGRSIASDEKGVLYNDIQWKRQWLAPNKKRIHAQNKA